jgi:hypothetical protein
MREATIAGAELFAALTAKRFLEAGHGGSILQSGRVGDGAVICCVRRVKLALRAGTFNIKFRLFGNR